MMVPFMLLAIFTPMGELIYVGGVHVFIDRLVILFGLARVVMTMLTSDDEVIPWGFNAIDKLFLASSIFGAIATILLFKEMGAVINQVGTLWDAIGGYFLIRFMIQDKEDIARFIKILAASMAVLAITMLNETIRAQNVFGYIGGHLAVDVRDGAIRARGPLAGPIVAGTFGATAFCLFVWLWKSKRSKGYAILGIIGCTIMAYTSKSSTPLLAYTASLMAISFWFLRKQMRVIRWGLALTLILLQLLMKAPVWFLINHIDIVAGNSGFHRAMLVNDLVMHFSEWWLVGIKTTAIWGWDMWDQANQFVAVGETGGLLALVFFIWMISKSFGWVGKARKVVNGDTQQEWEIYLLGGMLFSYVVSFFGISFSRGVEVYPWYALFAMIAVIATPLLHPTIVPETVPGPANARFRFNYASPGVSTRNQTMR